jgi:two-component system, OmpR family, sensor histidine kinase CpxA
VAAVLAREAAGPRAVAVVPPGLSALGDRELLTRAIANLVRNALRYAADAQSPVTVTASRANEHVIIAIEDEGPGVPAGSLPRLGEPFYRPESARTRETGGVGLGLAIVRSCVSACGGEVRFTNRLPRGFRAEVRLAVAPAAEPAATPVS